MVILFPAFLESYFLPVDSQPWSQFYFLSFKDTNIQWLEELYIPRILKTCCAERMRLQKSAHFFKVIWPRENQEVYTYLGHQGLEKQLV